MRSKLDLNVSILELSRGWSSQYGNDPILSSPPVVPMNSFIVTKPSETRIEAGIGRVQGFSREALEHEHLVFW